MIDGCSYYPVDFYCMILLDSLWADTCWYVLGVFFVSNILSKKDRTCFFYVEMLKSLLCYVPIHKCCTEVSSFQFQGRESDWHHS